LKVQTKLPNQRDDLDNLSHEMSPKYRLMVKLLLRLPNPSIPFFILKRLPLLEGIIYGLVMPIFVFLFGAIVLWLFPAATLAFGFPLNVIIVLLLPTIVLVIFIRIQLERTINWWRSVFGSNIEWDSSKSISELIELLKKQQRRTKGKSK